ncbi:MAG: hypothetical protein K2F93_02190 [Muribaculaceae bacterium]|nr:hypothetical protein [Muribaculaceae bacterium]
MKSDRAYAVSFGASDKYSVPFDGSIEEFRNSDEFKHIRDEVYDYVKAKFPEADVKYAAEPDVEPIDKADEVYPVLDADNLGKLKHDVARQVEVKMGYTALDSDAPYADIK